MRWTALRTTGRAHSRRQLYERDGSCSCVSVVPMAESGGRSPLVLVSGLQRYWVNTWGSPGGGVVYPTRDLAAARSLLRTFLDSPHSAANLRILAEPLAFGRSQLTDEERIERIAAELVAGRWVLVGDPVVSSYSGPGPRAPREEPREPGRRDEGIDWIEAELHDESGQPVVDEPFVIWTPDGAEHRGKTDARGLIRISRIPSGTCTISFPQSEYERA